MALQTQYSASIHRQTQQYKRLKQPVPAIHKANGGTLWCYVLLPASHGNHALTHQQICCEHSHKKIIRWAREQQVISYINNKHGHLPLLLSTQHICCKHSNTEMREEICYKHSLIDYTMLQSNLQRQLINLASPTVSYSLKQANESIPKMNRGNSCRQLMVWPLSEKANKQVNSCHYSIRALLC